MVKAIPDEQKQNVKTLIADIKSSIDVPPSETSLQQLKTDLKAAFSDRTLTSSEFKVIVSDLTDIVESAGVTPAEARVLFYDLQDIAETSRLPRTNDDLQGTTASDTLWTGLGNDTLTGTDTTNAGINEVDLLCGGGGKDTFVLGAAGSVFYNDGKTSTAGLEDYGAIADFNKKKDTIQLAGSSTDYTLGALSEQLAITGTGIYYTDVNSTASIPELVGVVVGVTLSDFSTGFSFV